MRIRRMVGVGLTFLIGLLAMLPVLMLIQIRYPPAVDSPYTPADFALSYTEETFTTSDGVSLSGWFIPRRGYESDAVTEHPTIVLLHGWPADKGNILPLFPSLAEEYNLFLFDFRGLGESERVLSTVGVREQKDARAALDLLEEKYGIREVGLWGFSMGGAVALMVASDERVRAVASHSSYASLSDMANELYPFPGFRYPLGFLTRLYVTILWGVDTRDASPEQVVGSLDIPLLLSHSVDDRAIPVSHGRRLARAVSENDSVELWFPSGGHGYLPSGYEERVREFFDAVFYSEPYVFR